MRLRKHAAILHAERSQIRWRHLQRWTRRAIALAADAVARRAIRVAHVLAGRRTGIARRNMLDRRLCCLITGWRGRVLRTYRQTPQQQYHNKEQNTTR